ncbi:A/G-specific adenine glycosylase [Lacihabitans soyangensis]|uniref:Adenine DNA glycosylase n=1 Tax=Lacihabitans soyangensis TaxID=869394 RepID=A0AAE3KSA0_9BACT|nr:A/G-specific adenine glycosylase [Lacihabitans soyangensis]MCP9763117.1 A/G-specific adenine glycosylase [Lacihabitans soyangensis]
MFAKKIISWYLKNKRDLPWRNTDNPYYIWLSEIILQQTRVQQGLPYYEKFVENFKTVEALAAANEGEVLRLWQGLGYYSRGRNLHKTAQVVVREYGGRFPDNFKDLQKLKGVGRYTAAAIASFAFNESVPAIDGNALRVLTRFFEIFDPIDSPSVQKNIFDIATDLMKNVDAGNYNQAVMELGATVCTPKNPNCEECPINIECKAFENKSVSQIPIKAKKTKVSQKFFQYFVFEHKGRYWLKKRADNEIWANMYDFYLVESENLDYHENLEKTIEEFNIEVESVKTYPVVNHILTHQKQQIAFTEVKCKSASTIGNGNWYTIEELDDLAKPKIIVDFIQNLKKG